MDDSQELITPVEESTFCGNHRFMILIAVSIILSFILVVVSIFIYEGSGAAQLDLSRPGYKDVRAQSISNDKSFQNYSNIGLINQSTIDEFKALFTQQAAKAKAVDAFSSDPLNPESLWSNTTTEQ